MLWFGSWSRLILHLLGFVLFIVFIVCLNICLPLLIKIWIQALLYTLYRFRLLVHAHYISSPVQSIFIILPWILPQIERKQSLFIQNLSTYARLIDINFVFICFYSILPVLTFTWIFLKKQKLEKHKCFFIVRWI